MKDWEDFWCRNIAHFYNDVPTFPPSIFYIATLKALMNPILFADFQ